MIKSGKWARCLVTPLVMFAAQAMPAMTQTYIDLSGVPLPLNASSAKQSASAFGGTWIGRWGGSWKTVLVVEKVENNGDASIIYALTDNPHIRFKRAWFRYKGKIKDKTLTVFGRGFTITFRLAGSDRLEAVFNKGSGFAMMRRFDLAAFKDKGTKPRWSCGEQVFLKTRLTENDKPVALETIIFKPKGKGPFPLAIVNHGSTGSGTHPAIAKQTWTHEWIAELLNQRGWLVAFPQRRGRGKSDGLYDEGFAKDRSKGYACNTYRSLQGADRALKDIHAAIEALRKRKDVNSEPVLMAGLSRGGALAIAYAGRHPESTYGAINFVGGWMGSKCRNAEQINQTLFASGAKFKRPTLWIYGRGDAFYPITHSEKNFKAFTSAGGTGDFVTVTVAGQNNGHAAMSVPTLWLDRFERYLDTLGRQ